MLARTGRRHETPLATPPGATAAAAAAAHEAHEADAPVAKKIKTWLGHALTPAARAWIRYAPLPLGKDWLWQRFHWRRHAFACRTRFGTRITGSTEDLIQRHLYYFGTWEPHISEFIRANLRPGDCFVDVGANIGHYSLLASNLVGPLGRVVAIEAARWIHATLDRHVALNGRRNIRTVQAAAADSRGVLRLFHGSPGNIGKTTTIARTGASSEVVALPLAEILTDDEIRRARIFKVDVEGAELQVLRGLEPVLGRLRRDVEIVMEISPDLMPNPDSALTEIFSIMQANGFGAWRFENDYDAAAYLHGGASRRPCTLGDCRLTEQSDILFSRRER